MRTKIPQPIRTLVRNSNRLLVPDRSRRVVMHSDELPTSLVQKLAKVSDRTFLSVVISHHLSRKRRQLSSFVAILVSRLLTMTSVLYAIADARPKLGSRGEGGVGISAPGISCVAGSSHTQAISCSAMTSCVLGPAAARRCFSTVRQYSSAQSWRTLQRRKTETLSCCEGCGLKKSWAW